MEEQAKILMTSEFLHRNFTSTELLMPLKVVKIINLKIKKKFF